MSRFLTLFVARLNGVVVATAHANSYAQANILLGAAKVYSNELEDYGPTSGKARVEYQEGLSEYTLVINTPKEVDAPGLRKCVESLLSAGYTSSTIRLACAFVAPDTVLDTIQGKFQAVKNTAAFAARPVAA